MWDIYALAVKQKQLIFIIPGGSTAGHFAHFKWLCPFSSLFGALGVDDLCHNRLMQITVEIV